MLELSVQELTVLLNLLSKAPCQVGDAPVLGPILSKAVALVNAGLPIVSKTPQVDTAIKAATDVPVAVQDVPAALAQ